MTKQRISKLEQEELLPLPIDIVDGVPIWDRKEVEEWGRAREERLARDKHGQAAKSGSPEYKAWHNMLQRCTNPNNPNWGNYGGRGIAVCPEWHEFKAFLRDMGKKPKKDLTLDRIDNDGNYEPGNCRWATRSQQRLNDRRAKNTNN